MLNFRLYYKFSLGHGSYLIEKYRNKKNMEIDPNKTWTTGIDKTNFKGRKKVISFNAS